MQFADPQATSIAYLILRHLYDGDVIEWPIADDHPQREIFAGLEAQGYVARWDRVWPLHDRYRLTEKGIAMIESVYRPAGAEAFFDEVRRMGMPPNDRRAYFAQRRLDPVLWPLLHDPSTHWSTFGTVGSRYQQYIWEDQRPPKRRRPPPGVTKPARAGGPPPRVGHPVVVHHVHHHHHHDPHVVDLDREVDDDRAPAPGGADYDVS